MPVDFQLKPVPLTRYLYLWKGVQNKKHDVLKEIVMNGCDLTIASSINHDVLRELAFLAQKSGAKLNVATSMKSDLLLELVSEYGDSIGFIHGLSNFEKDN